MSELEGIPKIAGTDLAVPHNDDATQKTSGDAANPRGAWTAIAAIVAAAVLWSLNGVLIKFLNDPSSANPIAGVTLAFYRSLLGGLVLLPLAWPARKSVPKTALPWLIGSCLCFTVMSVSFIVANTKTEAANAIILQYTSPIWVMLLSPLLLREAVRRTDFLAMTIAMVGVAIIFAGNGGDRAGLFYALLAGASYGVLTITLRGLRGVSSLLVTACNAIGSGLVILPLAARSSSLWISPEQIGWILVLGLVSFTLPYVLFTWGLRRASAVFGALIVLIETILNPQWTWLFLNETPPPATLLGAPLILAAVCIKILVERARRRSGVA
ncbi:MAG: DMT family transporter [Phycisphaerae bacterium]